MFQMFNLIIPSIILPLLLHSILSKPLTDSTLNLNEITWSWEKTNIFIGSPSILRLQSGEIITSADRFGSGFKGQPRNVSIFRSQDNGNTWNFSTWVPNQYWSNLFQLDTTSNDIYLLGTSTDGPAPIKISKSIDAGYTWNETTIISGSIHSNISYETGPTPSLLHNQMIYRAVERLAPPFRWGIDYQAVVIYANTSFNLLNKTNWIVTKPLPFNPKWMPATWIPKPAAAGFLEGNMVLGPDETTIYNILRFNFHGNKETHFLGNKAIVLQLNTTANELKFDSIIDLPGGHTKFVIRRDDVVTKMYVTLSNPNTIENATDQRNVLSLCTSIDMKHWKEQSVILMDDTGLNEIDSLKYTGFHYVDWQFDGKNNQDIIMSVRTAYRGAVSYHNSNRMTYKKIVDWKSLIKYDVKDVEL